MEEQKKELEQSMQTLQNRTLQKILTIVQEFYIDAQDIQKKYQDILNKEKDASKNFKKT